KTGTHAASNTILLNAVYPTQNQSFVAQLYVDLLNRPVDADGLSAWSGALSAGASRQLVVTDIEASMEYRTDEVENVYNTFLARTADQNGLVGFVEVLQLGGTIEQVKSMIIGSAEYYAKAGGTDDAFLRAIYHDVLGRDIDADGEVAWQRSLNA